MGFTLCFHLHPLFHPHCPNITHLFSQPYPLVSPTLLSLTRAVPACFPNITHFFPKHCLLVSPTLYSLFPQHYLVNSTQLLACSPTLYSLFPQHYLVNSTPLLACSPRLSTCFLLFQVSIRSLVSPTVCPFFPQHYSHVSPALPTFFLNNTYLFFQHCPLMSPPIFLPFCTPQAAPGSGAEGGAARGARGQSPTGGPGGGAWGGGAPHCPDTETVSHGSVITHVAEAMQLIVVICPRQSNQLG